ncbi:hypothetical protein WS90_31165 [Burkholderia cepacia]|uniref:DUF1488 domain-containing protein n=1 Tax=Burkholderia cepacia TaxID=292 RepID=A0A103Z6P3_BURCE|nr:hypothetical protein [Burkholderia cepacia]KVK74271.1 hypothetical protein WS90_31165 [Burkholderia cepacia]
MEDTFTIVDPKYVTTGDYLAFTIKDGPASVHAKISRSALAVLDNSGKYTDIEIFEIHNERIRKAAYEMRRVNPGLDYIALSSNNF